MILPKTKNIFQERGFSHVVLLLVISLIVVGIAIFLFTRKGAENLLGNSPSSHASTAEQTFHPLIDNKQVSTKLMGQLSTKGISTKSQILVAFKDGVERSEIDQINLAAKTKIHKTISRINVHVIDVNPAQYEQTLQSYKDNPKVKFAEPNFVSQSFFVPNDPQFGDEWGMAKIGASIAWDSIKNGSSPVAIIDTGIDSTHPDLQGEVESGFNTIDESTNTFDDNGHGTHVAGIIGASANNGIGIAGIAYHVTLMPIKALDSSGTGTYADLSEAIIYAADHGARIINMSLGGSSDSTTLHNAISYALSKGCLIVAAAGNNGNNAPVYPASYSGVLAVSASTSNDTLATFSSYGNDIFVAAPGTNIYSTLPGDTYGSLNGTSMAAPHVAGLLSLALSLKPSLSNDQLIGDMKQSSDKIGLASYDQNGWNEYYGYGRINAGKLIQAITTVSSSPTSGLSPVPSSLNTASPSQPVSASQNIQVPVEIEGTLTAIDTTNSMLSVSVTGVNQELVNVIKGNLAQVYVNRSTDYQVNNEKVELGSLPLGRVHIQGYWQDNQIHASLVLVQQVSSSPLIPNSTPNGNNAQSRPGSSNHPGNGKD